MPEPPGFDRELGAKLGYLADQIRVARPLVAEDEAGPIGLRACREDRDGLGSTSTDLYVTRAVRRQQGGTKRLLRDGARRCTATSAALEQLTLDVQVNGDGPAPSMKRLGFQPESRGFFAADRDLLERSWQRLDRGEGGTELWLRPRADRRH